MSAASTGVTVLGVVLALIGVALIAIDFLGKGDTAGFDYKDLAILVVGVVLGGAGAAMVRRKPSAPVATAPA